MKQSETHEINHDRRNFLQTGAATATIAAAALTGLIKPVLAEEKKVKVLFPPLPYPNNSLEPYISSKTINIHHDIHHRKFVSEVMARIKGTDYQNATLEKIIKETYGGINMIETLHLMAVLSWNHDCYWKSMKPGGGGEMPPRLKKLVIDSIGSVDAFKKKFKEAAMTLGSGWAWLVYDNGKVAVVYTNYHKTPLLQNQTPLITLDCWEHAYYLDYQNRKEEYVDAYLNHLVNWTFAESNLPAAAAKVEDKKKKAKK